MTKCYYESYRYTEEVCQVENQSIVECRFPGAEIAVVLSAWARVEESECICVDGEVKYKGKLLVGVLYEDVNRRICRAERGAEFYHKATNDQITPACFAKAVFTAQNITHRREGASTYLTVIVGACVKVYAQTTAEYLSHGDGVVVKKETQPFVQVTAASGEIEETDEFDAQDVTDVLLHEEKAYVLSCRAKKGEIDVGGEICYNVCALQEGGGVVRYERILPFQLTLPCEECLPEDRVRVSVRLRRAEVSATTGEEGGDGKISFVCGVYADCTLYKTMLLAVGTDAFSPTRKLQLKKQNKGGRYVSEQKTESRRVFGIAAASFAEEGWSLQAVFLPTVELVPTGKTLDGVLEAQALLKSEDGGYKTSVLSLPFSLDALLEGATETDCVVTGLTVRNFGKETEVEANLKITVCGYEAWQAEYIGEVEPGEEMPEKDCAVTVFLPRAGEGLWEVAKRMGVSPEEVEKCNPDVTFPIQKDERIVVYRQKT